MNVHETNLESPKANVRYQQSSQDKTYIIAGSFSQSQDTTLLYTPLSLHTYHSGHNPFPTKTKTYTNAPTFFSRLARSLSSEAVDT